MTAGETRGGRAREVSLADAGASSMPLARGASDDLHGALIAQHFPARCIERKHRIAVLSLRPRVLGAAAIGSARAIPGTRHWLPMPCTLNVSWPRDRIRSERLPRRMSMM